MSVFLVGVTAAETVPDLHRYSLFKAALSYIENKPATFIAVKV
jgi:hypothetical protein